MGNSVKKNTVYNIIKTCLTILFPLITFPYISRVLQADGVGKINFGNSIISYISLLASLGVSTYAIRECSKYKNEKSKLQKVASQIYSINLCSMLIAYMILIFLLIFVKSFHDYSLLILIQSTSVLFTVLGTEWLNTAMEEFRYITYRAVFFQILSLILMFSLVKSKEDYMVYAIITVISSSGAGIVNIVHRKKYCNVKFTFKMDLNKHLKPIVTLFAMILAQTIYCNMDITMLGLICGDWEVGIYSTSMRIYTIINQMIASVAFVVMPQLSKSYQEGNTEQTKSLLSYSLNFIGLLGIPCVVGMFVMAPEIIGVIGGSGYEEAIPIVRVLTVALAISLLGGFVGNIILLPSMREKIFLVSCVYAAIVNFVLNLFLIPFFGGIAAATTTVIAELITLFRNGYYVREELHKELIKDALLKPTIAGVVLVLAIYICSMIKINVLLKLLITIGVGSIVYFGILLLLKHKFLEDLISSITKKRKDEK